MGNIAFISLGSESHKNAEYLVKSVKKNCKNFKIIQISRDVDPRINETDYKFNYKFKSNTLMIDKLRVLRSVYEKIGSLFFLDSDMMVAKNLDILFNKFRDYDLVFTKRKSNFKINDNFQNIQFPEFTNKNINDVMPYNAGFIGINSLKAIKYLENVCLKLPNRFHFWYGDQYAQKITYDSNKFNILIEDYKYNNTIKNLNQYNKEIYVYHFKGRFKNLMKPFYNKHINL